MFAAQAMSEFGLIEAVFSNIRHVRVWIGDALYDWEPVHYLAALVVLVLAWKMLLGHR